MKPIAPRTFLAFAAGLAVALLAAVAWMNWRVDPLQFYRAAAYPPLLSDEARYQYPGLAKHCDFDTLILGTSVSLGFDPTHLRAALSPRTLNLAMAGASAHEQSKLLGLALRSGRVRHVVWDLNYEFFCGAPDWTSDTDGVFPAYFYDTNPWNEVPYYLLSLDTTKSALRVLSGRYERRTVTSLSRMKSARKPSVEAVRQAFERALKSGRFIFAQHPEEFAPERTRASFDANVIAVVRAHPDVKFDLFFPPVSAAYHALIRETAPHVFEDEFRWKEYVATTAEGAKTSNVRVHDLQGMEAIVTDFRRYVDTVHFDARTHDEVIDAIVARTHLATPEELKTTEALLRRAAVPP